MTPVTHRPWPALAATPIELGRHFALASVCLKYCEGLPLPTYVSAAHPLGLRMHYVFRLLRSSAYACVRTDVSAEEFSVLRPAYCPILIPMCPALLLLFFLSPLIPSLSLSP